MLRAAEALTLTAIQLLENEYDLAQIKQEFETFRAKNPYTCPIPAGVKSIK